MNPDIKDGAVEIERFNSDGEIYGEEALDELFTQYSDFDENEDSLEVGEDIALTALVDKS